MIRNGILNSFAQKMLEAFRQGLYFIKRRMTSIIRVWEHFEEQMQQCIIGNYKCMDLVSILITS